VCKGFLPRFSQTCPKSCDATFAGRLLVWPPKNGLRLFFCKFWVLFFEIKQRWGPFFPRFSGIFPRYLGIFFGFSWILPKCLGIFPGFPTKQNFWGALAPPSPAPLLVLNDRKKTAP